MGEGRAIATVRETLLSVLPQGVPPSFSAITAARSAGKGRSEVIVGDLVMFDGLQAEVTLRRWAFGWSHQWTAMDGGPASFEDGRWVRPTPSKDKADG